MLIRLFRVIHSEEHHNLRSNIQVVAQQTITQLNTKSHTHSTHDDITLAEVIYPFL